MTRTSTSMVLVFENVKLDVVDTRNVQWLRAPQIEGALGYNECVCRSTNCSNPTVLWLRGNQIEYALAYQNPSQNIQFLYDRNADEFTDEMTQLVELETARDRQQVRIH
ncbi:hypothetical protein YK56LOC_44410 [Caballeronia sp. HLA56]